MTTDTPTLNVRRFVDEQPVGAYQVLVLGLCILTVLMEGFDAQAMGFVAPAVSKQLHIARAALGTVLSSGLVGMMIGALTLGPLADRIGRKPVIVGSALLFGTASLLTATAHSISSLLTFRLITGIGLGASLPTMIALEAEYMPKRFRATSIVIAGSGFSLGATLGGLASARLLDHFGWQSVFVAGGVVPILIAAVLIVWLPESIRYLVVKGGSDGLVLRYLRNLSPRTPIAAGTRFVVEEAGESGFVVKQLFTQGRAAKTLLLWVIFFMNLLDVYFLNSWLPTVIHDSGIAVKTAILITTLFQAGGTVGALTLGILIDQTASYQVLAAGYLAATACVFLIGTAATSVPLLASAVLGAGFFVVGGQIGANALAAESYPTALRSTGVGWSLGIGRIGSITGPLVGSAILSSGAAGQVFSIAAVPMLIAAVAGFLAAKMATGDREIEGTRGSIATATSARTS